MTEILSFYRLHKDTPSPFFATQASACFDLHCMFDYDVPIEAYHSYLNVKRLSNHNKIYLEPEVDSQDLRICYHLSWCWSNDSY